jgi:hypothetical protein
MSSSAVVRKARCIVFVCCALALAAGFVSCGLDDYTYLPSVTDSGGYIVTKVLNNTVIMRLPNPPPDANYTIVYRMYVSGVDTLGDIQISYDALSTINSSLASDYNNLWSYADPANENTNTAGVGGAFDSRGYFTLALEDDNGIVDIGDALSSGELLIEFPANPQTIPTMTMTPGSGAARTYRLLRSKGPDNVNSKENTPLPANSRYFLNHTELNSKQQQQDPAVPDNLDVAASSTSASRRTYISLYIYYVDWDDSMNRVYSKPTFIGILKLPQA